MKLYYLNYVTKDLGNRRRWFTSMRKTIRHRTWLDKNREDYGIDTIYNAINKTDITPTLKGILKFLNNHCVGD